MRGSVLGSGVAHAALLAILLAVRYPTSYVVPGPDMVQVALVDPSTMLAPVPAAPEPRRAETPELKPVEDTGVKLEPPPKKKEKEKREKAPPQADSPAPALPLAQVGSTGLKGDLAVDAGNFEFTYYLIAIRNKIAANWAAPAGLSTGGNPVKVTVYFRVGRGGELIGVRLESSSGVEFFDRSAMRAVSISDPLPPLPLGFAGGELGVHFGFEWESP